MNTQLSAQIEARCEELQRNINAIVKDVRAGKMANATPLDLLIMIEKVQQNAHTNGWLRAQQRQAEKVEEWLTIS